MALGLLLALLRHVAPDATVFAVAGHTFNSPVDQGEGPQELPGEIRDAVGATAAESLLLGVFVMICSFELRGTEVQHGHDHVRLGSSYSSAIAASNAQHVRHRLLAEANETASTRAASVRVPPSRSSLGATGPSELGDPPRLGDLPKKAQSAPSMNDDDDAGSIYGLDMPNGQGAPVGLEEALPQVGWRFDEWPVGPMVMMMVLLHVVYPSFPTSPQVECGRILTFLGFLWAIGVKRCIAVVDTEPLSALRHVIYAVTCTMVQMGVWLITCTICQLIFPSAEDVTELFRGPKYLRQLVVYLDYQKQKAALASSDDYTRWAAWCVMVGVVFASAVWKEFLFRGLYMGGLKTRMPFWAASAIAALIYALAHEPLHLSPQGVLKLPLVASAPYVTSAMWYAYFYQCCNNLVVTIFAHLLFNAALFGIHFASLQPIQGH